MVEMCKVAFVVSANWHLKFAELRQLWKSEIYFGGFHLHLLVFPFVYQNRGSSLFIICKLLVQKDFSIISIFVCCDCYMKKNVAFTLISFAVLKWDDCLSVQLPFELPVQIPVQLLLELEPNWLHSSKCDWTRIWAI